METRIDPCTGTRFQPKRNNQKHLSKANRVKYWNDIANKERQELAWVEKPLKQNYKILLKALDGAITAKKHKAYLEALDYDFRVISGYDNKNGKAIARVYNLSIEQDCIDKDYFVIKNEDGQ